MHSQWANIVVIIKKNTLGEGASEVLLQVLFKRLLTNKTQENIPVYFFILIYFYDKDMTVIYPEFRLLLFFLICINQLSFKNTKF